MPQFLCENAGRGVRLGVSGLLFKWKLFALVSSSSESSPVLRSISSYTCTRSYFLSTMSLYMKCFAVEFSAIFRHFTEMSLKSNDSKKYNCRVPFVSLLFPFKSSRETLRKFAWYWKRFRVLLILSRSHSVWTETYSEQYRPIFERGRPPIGKHF